MKKSLRMVVALAACGVLCLPALPASARTTSAKYVGTFDPLTFGRCADARVPVNIGQVCFPVSSTDLKVKITSVDDVLGEAGLFYIMADATGTCVGQPSDPTKPCPNDGFICGHSGNLVIPRGTVGLDVYTDGVLGVTDCTVQQSSDVLGAAISGTITATFS